MNNDNQHQVQPSEYVKKRLEQRRAIKAKEERAQEIANLPKKKFHGDENVLHPGSEEEKGKKSRKRPSPEGRRDEYEQRQRLAAQMYQYPDHPFGDVYGPRRNFFGSKKASQVLQNKQKNNKSASKRKDPQQHEAALKKESRIYSPEMKQAEEEEEIRRQNFWTPPQNVPRATPPIPAFKEKAPAQPKPIIPKALKSNYQEDNTIPNYTFGAPQDNSTCQQYIQQDLSSDTPEFNQPPNQPLKKHQQKLIYTLQDTNLNILQKQQINQKPPQLQPQFDDNSNPSFPTAYNTDPTPSAVSYTDPSAAYKNDPNPSTMNDNVPYNSDPTPSTNYTPSQSFNIFVHPSQLEREINMARFRRIKQKYDALPKIFTNSKGQHLKLKDMKNSRQYLLYLMKNMKNLSLSVELIQKKQKELTDLNDKIKPSGLQKVQFFRKHHSEQSKLKTSLFESGKSLTVINNQCELFKDIFNHHLNHISYQIPDPDQGVVLMTKYITGKWKEAQQVLKHTMLIKQPLVRYSAIEILEKELHQVCLKSAAVSDLQKKINNLKKKLVGEQKYDEFSKILHQKVDKQVNEKWNLFDILKETSNLLQLRDNQK